MGGENSSMFSTAQDQGREGSADPSTACPWTGHSDGVTTWVSPGSQLSPECPPLALGTVGGWWAESRAGGAGQRAGLGVPNTLGCHHCHLAVPPSHPGT